jgi:hypothetical protein
MPGIYTARTPLAAAASGHPVCAFEWRPGEFAQPSSPIVIGVAGDDTVAESCRPTMPG